MQTRVVGSSGIDRREKEGRRMKEAEEEIERKHHPNKNQNVERISSKLREGTDKLIKKKKERKQKNPNKETETENDGTMLFHSMILPFLEVRYFFSSMTH